MSEIDISKYFVIHKDKRGKIFALVQINPEGLFEAITKQNAQLQRKEQECEKLKEINAEIQESEIELENMKNSLFIDYMKYKQVIEDIKEDVQYDVYTSRIELCIKLNKVKQSQTNHTEM